MSSPKFSNQLTTAAMSAIDRVLAKAGVYELHPIEDLAVILSATKVGEAGLLFALLNRSEQASVPVIRGLKPSMNGARAAGAQTQCLPRHPRLLVNK
ncbi:hypothetical protein SAMN02927900_03299 [Rhizobium mongolense subsp. loessense]|uniref:Uncharacterized protein n=1 Tax=Rhizobium mongolense subsp. loessense TaxID=158890 RepID=A0A1G4S1K2_9HYPH|nr:hypothetical protein [Rhizobium mongolense]SCW62881.1 hypothetical protein SAMN02927900_03299 [Rhizobium mongolense subsp. loessense]